MAFRNTISKLLFLLFGATSVSITAWPSWGDIKTNLKQCLVKESKPMSLPSLSKTGLKTFIWKAIQPSTNLVKISKERQLIKSQQKSAFKARFLVSKNNFSVVNKDTEWESGHHAQDKLTKLAGKCQYGPNLLDHYYDGAPQRTYVLKDCHGNYHGFILYDTADGAICNLEIKSDSQGHGLGGILLDHALADLEERNIKRATLISINPHATRLYKSKGFRAIGDYPSYQRMEYISPYSLKRSPSSLV